MNRYARELVGRFTAAANREYLKTAIIEYFGQQPNAAASGPRIMEYMREHFDDSVWNAAAKNEHEMRMSDPIPGVSIAAQLQCMNNVFIRERIDFIHTHVISNVETPDLYTVSDGIPTSRHGRGWAKLSADQMLESWKYNANHPVRARDDPSGELGVGSTPYAGPAAEHYSPGPHNSHYGMRPAGTSSAPTYSGITFCEQEHLGTSNHLMTYENTAYKNALNREVSYANTPFGVSTPMSDQRLAERRIFRSAFSVDGVENGVSRYEARLQRRHIDRDPSEGFRGESRDCQVRGYDMQSLYDRTDYHAAARDKNRPPCGPKSMHLDSNQQFWQ